MNAGRVNAGRVNAGRVNAGHWVATWTAAPQLTEPDNMPPPPFTRGGLAFADTTLRQTVRVSIGGPRIRLRFSNAYGGTDLVITQVRVALPDGGRAGAAPVVAGTSRAVTFGGRPAAVIPPGAQVVSDPLDFPLAVAANLTVTVYLAAGQDASGGITSHPGSRTTSYLAVGNDADYSERTKVTPVDHWYFLSGVDVWTGADAAAVVMLGDSLTDGRGSTTNGNDRLPDQLFARLRSRAPSRSRAPARSRQPPRSRAPSRRGTAGVAVLNQGLGGNRVLRDGLGPSALARLDRDVLAVSSARWLVVFEGVNDIGTADASGAACGQAAADLVFAYEQIAARARGAGIAVYGGTLTPFGGSEPYDDARGHREAARQAVNEWIRGSRRFDAVIDFDRAARDPACPRRLLPAFDSGDHLHLNPAGYRALAGAVPVGLFRPERLPGGRIR